MHWSWKCNPEDLSLEAREKGRADFVLLAAIESGLGIWKDGQRPETLSRARLQKFMEDHLVQVDGVPCKPNTRILPGAEVTLEVPPPRKMDLSPKDLPLEILFEDEHLAVVNKPSGISVHPSPTEESATLVNILLHKIQNLSGIGGTLRPGIVHRLDKFTSGALVITKTDAAHLKLTEIFQRHDIERKYWALCYGKYNHGPHHKIESLIGRHPDDRKKMSTKVKRGKTAITFVNCLKEFQDHGEIFACWLEARLETGRTHQVRVHLNDLGNSVLGDPTYGKPSSQNHKWKKLPTSVAQEVAALPGQALHARLLAFTHPITQEKLRFEANPPQEFSNLLKELEKYA